MKNTLDNLMKRKELLESEIRKIDAQIAQIGKKEEKPVGVRKSDIFFEAGKTYDVFMRTTSTRTFKCTEINLKENIVKGSYNGGEEKSYRATPIWGNVNDRLNRVPPTEFSIIVDKRSKTACTSKYPREGRG